MTLYRLFDSHVQTQLSSSICCHRPISYASGIFKWDSDVESSAGGYVLKAEGFKDLRVKEIRAPKGKTGECMVHTPSLLKALKQKVGKKDTQHSAPIPIEVSLQAKIVFGQVKCIGVGSGCKILVVVTV